MVGKQKNKYKIMIAAVQLAPTIFPSAKWPPTMLTEIQEYGDVPGAGSSMLIFFSTIRPAEK